VKERSDPPPGSTEEGLSKESESKEQQDKKTNEPRMAMSSTEIFKRVQRKKLDLGSSSKDDSAKLPNEPKIEVEKRRKSYGEGLSSYILSLQNKRAGLGESKMKEEVPPMSERVERH